MAMGGMRVVIAVLCVLALGRIASDGHAMRALRAQPAPGAEASLTSSEDVGQPCTLRAGRFDLVPHPYAERSEAEASASRNLVLLFLSFPDAAPSEQLLRKARPDVLAGQLRTHLSSADVVLIHETPANSTAVETLYGCSERADRPGAGVRMRCVRASDLLPPSAIAPQMRQSYTHRFVLWEHYLRAHAHEYEAVLVIDTDAAVQADPFVTPTFGGVITSIESTATYMGDCTGHTEGCVDCVRALADAGWSSADCDVLADTPIVNMGGFYGAARAVLDLIERFVNVTAFSRLERRVTCWEQPLFGLALWEAAAFAPHPVLLSTAEFGPFVSLARSMHVRVEEAQGEAPGGGLAPRVLSLASDAPRPYAVLHQWGRVRAVSAIVEAQAREVAAAGPARIRAARRRLAQHAPRAGPVQPSGLNRPMTNDLVIGPQWPQLCSRHCKRSMPGFRRMFERIRARCALPRFSPAHPTMDCLGLGVGAGAERKYEALSQPAAAGMLACARGEGARLLRVVRSRHEPSADAAAPPAATNSAPRPWRWRGWGLWPVARASSSSVAPIWPPAGDDRARQHKALLPAGAAVGVVGRLSSLSSAAPA